MQEKKVGISRPLLKKLLSVLPMPAAALGIDKGRKTCYDKNVPNDTIWR